MPTRAEPRLSDKVEISAPKGGSPISVGELRTNALAVSLKLSASMVMSAGGVIPALIAKTTEIDQNGQIPSGTPLTPLHDFDTHVDTKQRAGYTPKMLPVDVPSISPEGSILAVSGKQVLKRNWNEGTAAVLQSPILMEKVGNGAQGLSLTLSGKLTDSELNEFGSGKIALIPANQINPENFTYQPGNAPVAVPEIEEAILLHPDDGNALQTVHVNNKIAAQDPNHALQLAARSRTIQAFETESKWNNETHKTTVELTEMAAMALESKGLTLDHKAAELRRGDEVLLVLDSREQFAEKTGETPPPWVTVCPKTKRFGLPHQATLDFDLESGAFKIDRHEGLNYHNTIRPEAGKVYQAETQGPNGPVNVEVEFSPMVATMLSLGGARIDMENAVALSPSGTVNALDDRLEKPLTPQELAEKKASGNSIAPGPDSAPWQFFYGLLPDPYSVQTIWAPPTEKVVIELNPELGHFMRQSMVEQNFEDDFRGLDLPYKTKRRHRAKLLEKIGFQLLKEEASPGPLQLPKSSPRKGLQIEAPTEQTKVQLQNLGDTLFPPQVDSFDIDDIRALANDVLGKERMNASADKQQEFFQRLIPKLGFSKEERPSAGELQDALYKNLLSSVPVRLVAYPEGHSPISVAGVSKEEASAHLTEDGVSAAAIIKPSLEAALFEPNTAAMVLAAPAAKIESPEFASVGLFHEGLHIWEHSRATPEQLEMLDKAHEETTSGKREFSSLYGLTRIEFLTTLGEEFVGLYGDDGPKWLKEMHGDVYQLLSDITGADPVNGKPLDPTFRSKL